MKIFLLGYVGASLPTRFVTLVNAPQLEKKKNSTVSPPNFNVHLQAGGLAEG